MGKPEEIAEKILRDVEYLSTRTLANKAEVLAQITAIIRGGMGERDAITTEEAFETATQMMTVQGALNAANKKIKQLEEKLKASDEQYLTYREQVIYQRGTVIPELRIRIAKLEAENEKLKKQKRIGWTVFNKRMKKYCLGCCGKTKQITDDMLTRNAGSWSNKDFKIVKIYVEAPDER